MTTLSEKINPYTQTNNNLLASKLIEEFNKTIDAVRHKTLASPGAYVCDVLKKKFPEYRFDTRTQGWEWFFIEQHWVRFYFVKNLFGNYVITHYDFYEPFHKTDN